MGDPTYPLAPTMNILASVLVSLSLLTSNIRGSYHRGVVMFECWVLVSVVVTSIQTLLWHNTYRSIAPVLCDISTHLAIGWTAGIPACSLVMTRRMWHILSGKDESRVRREIIFDFIIGLGTPATAMVLYYIVQDARFDIVEDYGCDAVAYPSVVTVVLLNALPFFCAILSTTLYCWRIFAYFHSNWNAITGALSGPAMMDRARFVRILALSFIDILITLPASLIILSTSISSDPNIPFWPGWDTIHRNWEPQVTAARDWRSNPHYRFCIYWNEWVNVVYALAIFILLGTAGNTRVRARGTDITVAPSTLQFESSPGTPRKERMQARDSLMLDTINDTAALFTVTVCVNAGRRCSDQYAALEV